MKEKPSRLFDLSDKLAVVSGAASGMGKAEESSRSRWISSLLP